MKQTPLFDMMKVASRILMIRSNLLCTTGSMAGASVNFQQKKGRKIE